MEQTSGIGKPCFLRAAIGEAVRITRLRRRITQRDLAVMAGISRLTLMSLERSADERSAGVQLATAERVMNALGLSVSIVERAA